MKGHIYIFVSFTDFFEECIKEEQYEAEKLEILRDAVRAKAVYNMEMKKDAARSDSILDSEDMSSPRDLSPCPQELPPISENGMENGNGMENRNGVDNGNGIPDEHLESNGDVAHINGSANGPNINVVVE